MLDDGGPHLGGAAQMLGARFDVNRAVERRAEVVAFEFNRSEAFGAFWQMRNAAVTAHRVRQSNHGRRMQITVRRKQFLAYF